MKSNIDSQLYKDEQLLYWLYWGEKYSINQICSLLDCSYGKIHHKFKSYEIPRRSQGGGKGRQRMIIDNNLVKHLYEDLLLSRKEICSIVNCSICTLSKLIVKLKLKRKLLKKFCDEDGYNCFGRKVVIDVPKDCIDFFNGELLGDGSIRKSSFQYSSKYMEYVTWLSKTFTSWGIERSGKINSYTKNGKDIGLSKMINKDTYDNRFYTSYHYCSKGYTILNELYEKWYLSNFSFCPFCEIIFHDETVNRREWERYTTCPICEKHRLSKKVVPKDIELTPITLRQWFIGDGSNSMSNSNGLLFCTKGFLVDDINMLKIKLRDIGFPFNINRNNDLTLDTYTAKKFLKYIGPCPVECYNYKWNDKCNEKKILS